MEYSWSVICVVVLGFDVSRKGLGRGDFCQNRHTKSILFLSNLMCLVSGVVQPFPDAILAASGVIVGTSRTYCSHMPDPILHVSE